jgi:phosphatidylinositol alpha-1,6-mannosyltransferase
MGILVITWNFPPRRGGIENLIARLSYGIKKTCPLWVITSFSPAAANRQGWILRPRWPGLIPFFLFSLFYGSFLLWRNPGIEVILGASTTVAPVVILLAKIFRRRSVLMVHGLDLIYPNRVYQNLCVRCIRHFDRVVANSRYTAALARGKKASNDSSIVIPPGVDWEHFVRTGDDDPKEAMGLQGKKVLLYVGRLARRKGVREFLQRSFRRIVAEVPEVCFLIVGGNPTESLVHRDDIEGEIKAAVRELELEEHVRLLGSLSDADLSRLYRLSDMIVLPALSLNNDVEGFGIVILEGAAAGKPCVATRVGGIPDAVEDGKSGILVEPEDYDSMTDAVVTLLRNDARRSEMGTFARNRAREEFAWETIVSRYLRMFQSLTR